MPLRHWLRSATPRTTLVCVHRPARRPQFSRHLSSSPPTASSVPLSLQPALPSDLKNAWSWLFPESQSACECPTHITPREQKSYALHRERLHQALVDHFHEIEQLYRGNVEYVRSMSELNPGLLEDLAFEGQRPPFMLIDCSDSRVNEQQIFSSQPGTMFTAGNIANMFNENDVNSNAVLAYAVGTLGVKHVVVLGHYGCGGVAASMSPLPQGWEPHVHGASSIEGDSSPPEGSEVTCPPPQASELAVQKWIQPIRCIYEMSDRWEIRAHRERAARQRKYGQANQQNSKPLHMHDPAFRALVEENVKANTKRVAESQVIKGHYAKLQAASSQTPAATDSDAAAPKLNPVYVHGWVYDLETGVVSDLGVSTGPPGWTTPRTYSGGFPYTR